jgi:SET domain-containing protein
MLVVKHKIDISPIAGLGLFAGEMIPKGTLVWQNFTDSELILADELFVNLSPYMQDNFKHYGYHDKMTKEWKLPLDNSRFMNHSDQHNLIQDDKGNSLAMKDIRPGEELTCDYRGFVDVKDYPFL